MSKIISAAAIARRGRWVEEIRKLSGKFGDDYARLESELQAEIKNDGYGALLDHLRLCGDIPESYGHDTSEEKLYSKYTDALLAEAFKALGLKSIVLSERADVADVEVFAGSYDFIADAKSFRLSRTAKNQKDFKVQAMDGWKRGKMYAMVVCPIYQLPTKASQIYQQASTRNVCIFTYSHLAMVVAFSLIEGGNRAKELIHEIFKVIPAMNPTKDGSAYWLPINKTMLAFSSCIEDLWNKEKQAAVESIKIAKEEALIFLANERARIMHMSHDEAITELIKINKLESRMKIIVSLSDNGLLNLR